MSALEELFTAVREASDKQAWSQGVTLARRESVSGDFASDEEIVLRVKDDSRPVGAEVQLYPSGEDWHCDCGSDEDPCRHVVASIIAVRTARKEGKALPQPDQLEGKLEYSLERQQDRLRLAREIVTSDQAAPLTHALSSGRVPVIANKTDMAIDVGLNKVDGHMSGLEFRKLAPYLSQVELSLAGSPVTVVDTGIGILCELRDEGPGIQLTASQDPLIEEMFANGIARCGDQIHWIRVPDVPDREKKFLKEGRYFAPNEFDLLASEVLPRLEKEVRLLVHTKRLPARAYARPRLAIDIAQHDATMYLKAQIVYGDPPVARVIDGRLVAVGTEVPRRDQDAESRIRDEMWRKLEINLDTEITFDGAKAIVVADKLRRIDCEIRGSLEAFQIDQALTPVWEVDDDNIGLHFTGQHGGKEKKVDAKTVLAAWERGENLFSIPGGGFAPLPKDWLKRFGARALAFLDQRDAAGETPKAAALFLADMLEEDDVKPPPSLNQLRDHLRQVSSNELPVPDMQNIKAELRTYQKHGVGWLHMLKQAGLGAMLADDMGLGKTLQAICVLEPQTLIVAPTSLLSNWQREVEKFRPELTSHRYHGPNRTLDTDAEVVLTTYATMRMDIAELKERDWACIVLDEAQNIKNPDSQAAKAAHQLRAGFRVCLTGTPLENHLDDIWSQFHFLNPGLLGSRQGFTANYTRPIKRDLTYVGVLSQRIRPFLLRRIKSEVAKDLPPRQDQVLYVDLDEKERETYQTILAATRSEIKSKLGAGNVFELLEALLRLRQTCCHLGLLPQAKQSNSSKVDLLLSRLAEGRESGSRALVFSQWTSLLNLVAEQTTAAGLSHLCLTGETKDRAGVVDAFQAGEADIMLMTLKAGGVGLNLTAADHVYILDPWWNPAAEDQAADRAHRIGQTRSVIVHKLVATDTIEESILALQNKKRELAAGVLQGDGSMGGVTRDELLSLID